ncbi:MAG TPA: Imm52 family immunity protein, partial [Cystobacter sp.]
MPETVQRSERYYAGAYWGPRKEPPEECARRAEAFLTSLSRVDPTFSRWFQQGRSRKDALKRPIEPDLVALEKLIRRGKDRVREALGHSVWAWNGEPDDYDASGFHIECGGYSEAVPNRCVFHLPNRGPNAERVLSATVLSGLMRSTAMAWDPDWGTAMSTVHRDLVDKDGRANVWVGWVTYLSRQRGRVPPLPAPVRIEPVEDKGTLLIL